MKKLSLLALCLSAVLFASAQKVTVKGDLKCLKSEQSVNIKFTYDNMTVGKMSEADYIEKKVSENNEKEAGKGDKWKEAWESDKVNVYPVKFCELFAKYSTKEVSDADTKYQITVNTDFFEPGYNVGVMRKDASINVTVKVVDTEANKEVATITITNALGRTFSGYDFSVADRVGEAYAKAGKEFGARVAKACK